MRSILCNRKNQLIFIFGFSIFILYFNWRAVDLIEPVPQYKTTCDLEIVKGIIENLVRIIFHSIQGNF
jgi:hypothetical protein